MSVSVKVSNAWKYTKNIYVNVSSTWKTIFNMYTNVNGSWKPLYNYWYSIGDWSSCSVTCGGGTQTRNVVCYRSDYTNHSLNQIAVSDSFCSKAGITKPSTSQACNTQSCNECKYDANTYWNDESALINMGEGECTGYSYVVVMWDGEAVAYGDGDEVVSIDGGYKFTRSTLQSDTGSIRCPTKLGAISKRNIKYTVCRTPI